MHIPAVSLCARFLPADPACLARARPPPPPPPPPVGPPTLPQIAGQTAFFVALFRQQTRERVFDLLERVVPDVLPFLHLGGLTPAQVLCGDRGRVLRAAATMVACCAA